MGAGDTLRLALRDDLIFFQQKKSNKSSTSNVRQDELMGLAAVYDAILWLRMTTRPDDQFFNKTFEESSGYLQLEEHPRQLRYRDSTCERIKHYFSAPPRSPASKQSSACPYCERSKAPRSRSA